MAKKDIQENIKEPVVLKLLTPRITEKSGILSGRHAYTFAIPANANKPQVVSAFKKEYKKTPIKVSILNLPKKPVTTRGKETMKGGIKKAVVYLKKGDKIEFI